MTHKLLIVTFRIAIVYGLSCSDVLDLPGDIKLTMQQLQRMLPKDIVQCLAHLGKEQLGPGEADLIWRVLVQFYDGIPNVPESTLSLLHWVTPAITPDEYSNITLSSIDVIENFGLNYNLHSQQLAAIASRVQQDFAGKEPEDYTYYDLVALRQILCAFNISDIERIHPVAYREAALTLGKLQNCNPEVLAGFASLAVNKSAFGPPNKWNDATVETIGVVAKYVREVADKYKPPGEEYTTTHH